MKVLLTDNAGSLWMQDIARPTIGDYECLVRMESCAFCHSTDRHIVAGTVLTPFHNPSVLGHESVGLVEETGAKVRYLRRGDRVVRVAAVYPDEVDNGIGSAWGGFAQSGKVTDWQAMVDDGLFALDQVPHELRYMQKVPADIPPEQTELLIGQKEIYSAAGRIEEVSGRQFLVAGAGITACFFGLFLKRRGAARVTMAARRQAPLDLALSLGVIDDGCLIESAMDAGRTYDGLVETTGNKAVTGWLADAALRDGGAIYSYAVYEGMTRKGFFDDLSAKHPVVRVNPAEAAAHDEVMAMIREGELDARPFVTARFPFDDWEAAWRSVVDKTSLKTVIRFDT